MERNNGAHLITYCQQMISGTRPFTYRAVPFKLPTTIFEGWLFPYRLHPMASTSSASTTMHLLTSLHKFLFPLFLCPHPLSNVSAAAAASASSSSARFASLPELVSTSLNDGFPHQLSRHPLPPLHLPRHRFLPRS